MALIGPPLPPAQSRAIWAPRADADCRAIELLLAIRPHKTPYGLVAEWLRSGLQIRAPRFDSGPGLQIFQIQRPDAGRALTDAPARQRPDHKRPDRKRARIQARRRPMTTWRNTSSSSTAPTTATNMLPRLKPLTPATVKKWV